MQKPERWMPLGNVWLRGVWGGLHWETLWRGPFRSLTPFKWSRYVAPGYYRVLTADELGMTQMPQMPQVEEPGKPVGVNRSLIFSKMVELNSWLCDATYPDGKPLGSTQLAIRRRGQNVYLTLKLADSGGVKVEVCEPTIDMAFVALEALLSGGKVPWRKDEFPLDGQLRKKR